MNLKTIVDAASKLPRADQVNLVHEVNRMIDGHKPTSNQKQAPPQAYTISQAAELLQASNKSVTRWFDSGKLRGYRIEGPRALRIKHSELVKFLKRKKLGDRIPKKKITPSTCYTSGQTAKIIGVTWVQSAE